MLIFLDESFRDYQKSPGITLGALCGIGIKESDLSRVSSDIFLLKAKHMGNEFARDREIKGKSLLSNYAFSLKEKGLISRNLTFARDLVDYIVGKQLPVFGCVCFEKGLQRFKAENVTSLDKTFRFLFERIDMWMKINHQHQMACLVFDDRDYGINRKNSEAITNFFQRSAKGLSMDSIVKTPFFAISQSQNVGLQLADFVTTIIGLRFSSNANIFPYFHELRKAIPIYHASDSQTTSCLKVIRNR